MDEMPFKKMSDEELKIYIKSMENDSIIDKSEVARERYNLARKELEERGYDLSKI